VREFRCVITYIEILADVKPFFFEGLQNPKGFKTLDRDASGSPPTLWNPRENLVAFLQEGRTGQRTCGRITWRCDRIPD
jgi:hypothetical protein